MAIIDLSQYNSVRDRVKRALIGKSQLSWNLIPLSVDLSKFTDQDYRPEWGFMKYADYTIVRDFNPGGYWAGLDPAYAFKDKILLTDPSSTEEKKFRHKHRNFTGSVWTIKKNRSGPNIGHMVIVLDRHKMTDPMRVYYKLQYTLGQRI